MRLLISVTALLLALTGLAAGRVLWVEPQARPGTPIPNMVRLFISRGDAHADDVYLGALRRCYTRRSVGHTARRRYFDCSLHRDARAPRYDVDVWSMARLTRMLE